MADVTISTNPEPSEGRVAVPSTAGYVRADGSMRLGPVASTSDASVLTGKDDEKKVLNPLLEFCRLVNISIWQNTKSRGSSGFKDDDGESHPMYRYAIK
jgi:hypothetical protein